MSKASCSCNVHCITSYKTVSFTLDFASDVHIILMVQRSSVILHSLCLYFELVLHPQLWIYCRCWCVLRTASFIFRSTPPCRPNKVGLKCTSVRPSTESFFDFIEIWYVGRGWWVMHDGMQYDSIQGQGHEPLKVGNSAIFKGYLLPHL